MAIALSSILGLLFFLLYINDLCNVSKTIELILFADDTNIFYSHKDLDYSTKILNEEIDKLSEWLISHSDNLSISS